LTSPALDFRNLRRHRGSQNDGFEELTRQLILADPPAQSTRIENRGPGADGGVEVLVHFAGNKVWGWQSKFFLDKFGTSEISQIKKSFSSALANFPTLECFYVAIPRNLSGAAVGKENTQTQNWENFLHWAKGEAEKNKRSIQIILWDESYFVKKLQSHDARYAGIRAYWFQETTFTNDWFQKRFDESRQHIGMRYREDDHIDLRVNRTFRLIRREPDYLEREQNFYTVASDALQCAQGLARSSTESISKPASTIEAKIKATIEKIPHGTNESFYAQPIYKAAAAFKEIKHNTPELYQLLGELSRKKETTENSKISQPNYVHDEAMRYDIRKLQESIGTASSEFSNLEISLLKASNLVVCGEAGSGKSHLLAEEVHQHIKNGMPACFIPSRVIDDGSKPQTELLNFLGCSGIEFETFLSAMSAASYAVGKPALIVIDGINESFKAAGWESGLPVLLEMIKRYENLVLIVSVRKEYQKLCIRDGLEIAQLQHHGFSGHLDSAVEKYLDRNGIERPSAPIIGMRDVLYNPLFLSTAVDALVNNGETSFPRDLDNISKLIIFWINVVERNLIKKGFQRILLADNKTLKVINKIAEQMALSGDERLSFDTANQIAEEIVGLAPPSAAHDRFIQRLIDEGVFIDYPSHESGTDKFITFGFQKFSDYFIADYMLKKCTNPEDLANSLVTDGEFGYLFDKEKYNSFAGIRTALFSLTPKRFGCELPDLREGFTKEISMHVNEFIDSLTWRSAKSITLDTLSYLENLRAQKPDTSHHQFPDEDWFSLLLNLALMPDCILNAKYLAQELRKQPLPIRDASWSAYLVGRYEQYEDDWEIVFQIIDWAWLAPKLSLDPKIAELAAITLALFTSTNDRQLRDCASKALANLLLEFPEQISGLIDFFSDWDDPYVRERVLAAALAGILYTDDRQIWKNTAIATDRMVFNKYPVEWHAWIRRYGQKIVEHAAQNGVNIDRKLIERAKAPYASNQIVNWPTIQDIGSKQDEAESIVHSVIGFMSEPYEETNVGLAGDFGRYTMGGIDRKFSLQERDETPPKPREQRIVEFWEAVESLGGKAAHQSKKIREIFEKCTTPKMLLHINYVTNISDQQLFGTVSDNDLQKLAAQLGEAQAEFIAILPDELADEFRKIEPLNPYKPKGISTFPMQTAQCWIVQRCLELGWDNSLHESLEKALGSGSYYDRHEHGIERIGKKYQHIAYQELIGNLADHHWYIEDLDAEINILDQLETFERPDIDISFFAGSLSRPLVAYDPGGMQFPAINFEPQSIESNKEWATHCSDAPDPTPFLVQTGNDGFDWAIVNHFARNKDYIERFHSEKPLRSCQYSIELILVHEDHVKQLLELKAESIVGYDLDAFDQGWSTPEIYGQRSFRSTADYNQIDMDNKFGKIPFTRIGVNFSPKYSEYDYSGAQDSSSFITPKPSLIKHLKLKPKSPWSCLFTNEDDEPAFVDTQLEHGQACIIRLDLLNTFAKTHNLQPVWRVWLEKDGGQGIAKNIDRSTFVRKDYIAFFSKISNKWIGNFRPFRN